MVSKNARSGEASKRLTRLVIEHYGPVCWLQLPGCTRLATTKDHVVPVDHGGTDAIENLRPACHTCNSKRRNLAISGAGGIEVIVIVGPPSPDQQMRASQEAGPGDLIIDRGLIAQALTVPGSPGLASHVEQVAGAAYSSAVSKALRMAARCRVVIVHPVPSIKQIQQYARLRYQIITEDPGRAVAEHHATVTGDRRLMLEVSAWYARYPEGAASIERTTSHRPTSSTSRAAAAAQTIQPSRAW